jgi:tetratricopeptide (TPR) repeat protein
VPSTAERVALLDTKARAYSGLGKRDDALAQMREALALQTRETGKQDMRSLRVAARLGTVLSSLGRIDELDAMLSEYLPADRGTSSADDPVVGETLLILARTARRKQDYERADALASEALDIYRKVYGERASQTATAMNSLANIAQAKGDYARSLSLFETALSIKREVFGEEGSQVSPAEHNVGLLLLTRLNRPRESLPHLRRALELGKKQFPEGHLNNAAYRLSLGSNLRVLGQYAEAEPLLREALRAFEVVNAPRGGNIALSRGELACIALIRGGRGREAAKAQLAASIAAIEKYDKDDPQLPGLVACAR